MNHKELCLPRETFNPTTLLLEIGIIENLTINRMSYDWGQSRVFTFNPEIWPAVVLMLERMYKVDANKFLNEAL